MTMSKALPMRNGGPGAGERAEATRRRKKYAVLSVLFAAGLFTGLYVGRSGPHSLLDRQASWDPAVSLALAAIFVVAVVGGSIALHGGTDEVQRQAQYKAVTVAGGVYMLLYPAWFMLWKGGHVPEPHHAVLFVAFWLSLAGASLWYRLR
jgi:hypothetical protein